LQQQAEGHTELMAQGTNIYLKNCYALAGNLITSSFGILSPLLPSGGASEPCFPSAVPEPSSHFCKTCFKVIMAQIKSHSWII
jgi:hypothetical protein